MGNDINFCMPPSDKHYDERKGSKWKYNTSGIIIRSLDQVWDESFVLVFPLKNIGKGKDRKKIECGIGNNLIDKGVPILDYYSQFLFWTIIHIGSNGLCRRNQALQQNAVV